MNLTWLVVGICSTLMSLPVQAQGKAAVDFPVRPIRVLQPAPPGGASDVILRVVTQKLSTVLGQSIVVDNRPGAHGIIASEITARATADGYTLLYGTVGTLAINSGLYAKLPYRMPDDFAPITQFVDQANLVLVNAAQPVKSLGELVQLAKAKPGQLFFGSAGSGSATHLGPEMFRIRAGIDMKHVPYKGAAAAAIALAGGEIQVMFVSPVTAIPFIRTGKIRALAVSTAQRIRQLPDLPTIAESGYPGFSYGAWSGMLAPAGTPGAIVSRLHSQITGLLKTQEMQDLIAKDGANAAWSETPEAFSRHIRSEIVKWTQVIKQTGARVE
jgi:tripartite-type tricarboxylate transporter receptor subunit TctC